MKSFRAHAGSALLAIALCAPLLPSPAAAQTPIATPNAVTAATIDGAIVDASNGVPIAGAVVRLTGRTESTSSDAAGRFRFAALLPGNYQLSVTHDGYQPSVSELLHLDPGVNAHATLTLQRGTSELHTIAVTSTSASSAVAQTSAFTRALDTEDLGREGTTRIGDALRELPGVNNGITGNTAALSDDLSLSIRGIGTLETVAAIDGHPIAYGVPGGYNFQVSPVFPFRNVQVLYGSGGSDLLGVNAIGGVVNFQTLDPTPQREFALTQGYGTWDDAATGATATGTIGKLGYALAYGVSGIDGPLHNDYLYQPGAAYDQSATVPSVRDLAIYKDDSSAVSRSGLEKLRYRFDNNDSITLTSVNSSYWDDKTGNGDGDYLGYAPALAFGGQLLNQKQPTDPCPSGTFTATNANGVANGAGPGGIPDGGTRCQTPQQYAQFNEGWQGAGPSWQSFGLNDEDLTYTHAGSRSSTTVDLFNSRYVNNIDRRFMLPFINVPADNGFSRLYEVTTSGAIVSHTLAGINNDFTFGANYMNNAYINSSVGANEQATIAAPFDSETAYFIRDTYHPANSPLSAFVNVWAKHASETGTSYVDPRVALVYHASPHDVLRASYGVTTTQPSSDMIDEPFVESPPGGAGGGAPITCGAVNSIGNAPSSLLQPERGIDEELAYAHRWSGDTQTEISFYNTDVFDKLYSTVVPLSVTGTSFIDPAYLASVEAQIAGKCGIGAANSLLGVSGNFNIGTLRADGADLSGRVRVNRHLFVDYDWALTSTVLLGASPTLLQANQTLILNDQLPRLPLHTFTGAVDETFGSGLNVRYTLYAVSVNNTKSLPAYDYSDIRLSYPFHTSTLSMTISNLFNQWGSIAGLRYQGVPLPLNSYATAASYAPYTGAGATEQFGLPYRSIYFSYEFRT